jgi:Family of unknown function (DUF6499)
MEPLFTRPDWTNEAAYAHIKNASLNEIAWEFLRRNPEYDASWQTFAAYLRSLVSPGTELARYVEWELSPSRSDHALNALGDSTQVAALKNSLTKLMIGRDVPEPWNTNSEKEWGLNADPHPNAKFAEIYGDFEDAIDTVSILNGCQLAGHGEVYSRNFPQGSHTRSNSNWLILQIDLCPPLEAIQASVMNAIKEQRESRIEKGHLIPIRSRTLAKTKYVEYLRILDGMAAIDSISSVAQTIAPNEPNDYPDKKRDKRFRAALNEARRLQATGYKTLPLLTHSPVFSRKK